jgi:hypothetical protein
MSAETGVVAELKTCLNLIRKIDVPSVSLAVAPLVCRYDRAGAGRVLSWMVYN